MNMIEERNFQFALKIIQLVKSFENPKNMYFLIKFYALLQALVLMLPKREQDNLKRTLFLKKQEKLDIGYVY